MKYGIKTISTLDFQQRGIRKIKEYFIAVNGADVKIFKTLNSAIKYLAKQGYDAFGDAL